MRCFFAVVLLAFIAQADAEVEDAAWKDFEKAVISVGKTLRGTLSVSQIRSAVGRMNELVGLDAGSVQGPIGVENWIKQHLLPQALQTKDEMQHEVDMAVNSVKQCQNLLWSAEKEVEHREAILLKDESGKYQCTSREQQLEKSSAEKCKDLASFASGLKPPPSINSVEKTVAAMKEAMNMNHAFYSTTYPQFMQLKQACDSAKAAEEAQRAECDADEAAIEDFYCQMKSKRDEACAAYDKCYKDKSAAMETHVKKVKDLEATVKEHFQSMACAGEAFGEEGDSQAECDPNAYETNHLDVHYPTAPIEQTCVSLVMTGKRDYSAIVCDGDSAASSTSSSNSSSSAEASPTPAPALPSPSPNASAPAPTPAPTESA